MNAKQVVFWIYVVAFAIGALAIVSIPQDAWKYIADWQKGVFGFQILLGICGILIAWWVSEDDGKIEDHRIELRHISERVHDLERELEKKENT